MIELKIEQKKMKIIFLILSFIILTDNQLYNKEYISDCEVWTDQYKESMIILYPNKRFTASFYYIVSDMSHERGYFEGFYYDYKDSLILISDHIYVWYFGELEDFRIRSAELIKFAFQKNIDTLFLKQVEYFEDGKFVKQKFVSYEEASNDEGMYLENHYFVKSGIEEISKFDRNNIFLNHLEKKNSKYSNTRWTNTDSSFTLLVSEQNNITMYDIKNKLTYYGNLIEEERAKDTIELAFYNINYQYKNCFPKNIIVSASIWRFKQIGNSLELFEKKEIKGKLGNWEFYHKDKIKKNMTETPIIRNSERNKFILTKKK